MNLIHDLFQKIAVTIASIYIVVTSTFTEQKPLPTTTPIPSPVIVETASPSPAVTIKPATKKTAPPKAKITPSLTPIALNVKSSPKPTQTPNNDTQTSNSNSSPQTPRDIMPDKPIIESFCDNKGNCIHSQFADPNSNSSLSSYPTVHVGETLNFTIKVSGEETSGVLAFIISQGYDGGNLGRKPWNTNLTYTKTFSKEDISTSGYPIYAYIKSQNDNYHRRSTCNWADYPCDDSATLMYTVIP